jgi:hypothetical protein
MMQKSIVCRAFLLPYWFPLILFMLFSFSGRRKVNIWLIGDSTMARKTPDQQPESGWGEAVQPFFKDNVVVHNHIPVICSSIVRRHFNSEGQLKNTHGDVLQSRRISQTS